jgi:hypothetical protein
MPAIMTLGGIALAVLGLLIAILGMPERAAGLGLGSDLIQAGASVIAGGLVIAALGQVLKALKDLGDRIEEAGYGLSGSRPALNDERSDRAPMPLPRASASGSRDDLDETPPAPPAREPRTPRTPAREPAPRPAARSADAQRLPPRAAARPEPQPQQQEDFAEEYPQEQEQPRWMRTQAEGRQPSPGSIPLQPQQRPSRATPTVPPAPGRREAVSATPPKSFEPEHRRRVAPHPEEIEPSEPTVVRSGIIAGMAYTLYSDRSIEAELPAGTVRFGSIEELQEHVRRAGVDEQEVYRGQNPSQH